MRKLRFGVLGTAKIAREKVVPPMRQAARCEVVAIASREEATARQAAAALGIPTAYGSYEALLADPGGRGGLQSRCPTTSTCPGRCARPRPASTCCARSRSG